MGNSPTNAPEPRVPRTGVNPTCYVCRREIDGQRVIWAHRGAMLQPMHPTCAHPVPRVHGVVVK